ncbi:hypothetical protein CLCR_09345 [Cladophialophora carrionii]|uniref:Uncharacterized protein n=1 Tax=Cladophialophora carrionii TaxID=86049 RepID=A0A1C1CTQ7_9EURO|nr:hypothetical protein CLCR_09345 [Cladophialophora carrionii]
MGVAVVDTRDTAGFKELATFCYSGMLEKRQAPKATERFFWLPPCENFVVVHGQYPRHHRAVEMFAGGVFRLTSCELWAASNADRAHLLLEQR